MSALRIDCVLIVGGRFHDMDFARLQLLKLLGRDERVRVRVFEDFEAIAAIASTRIMVSYTCDVVPSLEAQTAIQDWVRQGGRWLALHGVNSVLQWTQDGLVDCPDVAPIFMDTLGSRFLAHPPIQPYKVSVADPTHPLVAGIAPFTVSDELYLMQRRADLHVLLETEFEGDAPGFSVEHWIREKHPVFYRRPLERGEVLYLTLGHCRGHYDMQPRRDWWPTIDRCSWELPVFHTLLSRAVDHLKAAQEAP